jgi:hypothetical protein
VSGKFSWTPTYKQGGVPPTSYPTVFRVTEKNRSPALTDSVVDTIFVKDTNIAPVFVNPGNQTVDELQLLTFNLRASDIDSDAITFSMGGAPAGAQIFNGNQFVWRPTGSQAGVYQVNFYATDNGNPPLSDSAKVIITVIDTTVPVFTKDSSKMVHYVQACAQYRDTLMATDADNDSLTYKKLSGPAALTVGKKGVVTWIPSLDSIGKAVPVSATVEDPYGNKDTLIWTITVLPRWPKIYPLPTTNDTGFSVIQISGGYAVCGTISGLGLEWPFLMLTDTSGNAVKIKTYGGLIAHASAYSLQQTTDGGFILCGTDSTAAGSKLMLIKTTDSCDTQWTARFIRSPQLFPTSKGASVCQTGDGGFIACGTAFKGTGSTGGAVTEMYLVKTDGSGTLMWDSVYYTGTVLISANAGSAGFSVSPTVDGGYIASGEISAGLAAAARKDIYLVKIDANGDSLWTKSFAYQVGAGIRNVGLSVQAAGDGSGYYIGGFSSSTNVSTTTTALVLKTGTHGDSLWTWAGAGGAATSVRATADGGCIASGFQVSGSLGGNDASLIKLESGRTVDWTMNYGTAGNDRAYGVATTPDGGYIFTGFAPGGGATANTDVYLVKTDGSGNMAK